MLNCHSEVRRGIWPASGGSFELRAASRGKPRNLQQLETRPSPYWLNEKRLRDQKIAMIGDKIFQAARLKT
ncbi:MAG: hypothetical protein IH831_02120, partial [Planctomycetes bacterium]|nr:hypothetical protein [Planctomycetota bacterium]